MDDDRVGAWRFQDEAADWRVVGCSGMGAWFDAPDHRTAAELVRGVASLLEANASSKPSLDVRGRGVQVWIAYQGGWTTADLALAQGISVAARELGLVADPSVPQELEWGIETLDDATLTGFWQTLLGYEDTAEDDLLDPLRRDPRFWFYEAEPRPLRQRIHVDVSVPREQAEQRAATLFPDVDPIARFEKGWSLLADPEGNEADLVPADAPDEPGTDDWRLAFAGMVFYPTVDLRQSAELAVRVAEIADRSGLPLSLDVRAPGVMIDTGKDLWEDARFNNVARSVQTVARDLGLVADPSRVRFVQLGVDAVDVPRVREFWRVVLGYENDPRDGVSDIVDPRGLNHPMIFQSMDADDVARRRQRNRIHLDLYLPYDQVGARQAAALAAGGRWTRAEGETIADPEGNEIDICTGIAGSPPEASAS